MRLNFRAISPLLALTLALTAPPTTAAPGVVERIGAEEFKKLADGGQAILLDVRRPEETRKGQIPGSSSIDFLDPSFRSKVARVQKDKPVLVYCASGGRSAKAVEMMGTMGFRKVYDLAGGIRAWQAKGYPVTPAEAGARDAKIRTMTPADFRKLLDAPGPLLADFHTEWCVPCRKMAPVVDRLATSYEKKATIVRIDTDSSPELADAWKIDGVPVFILFDKGKEVWRANGIVAESELRKQVDARLRGGS